MSHTPGPWREDDGMLDLEEQALNLIEDIDTEKEWIGVGTEDKDGFAAVVAFCHPSNAPIIAAAPLMLEALKDLLQLAHSLSRGTDPKLDSTERAVLMAAARAISKATTE